MGLVELKAAEFYCDKCHTKSRVVHHGRFERPELPPGWSKETVVIHGDYPAYDESKDLYYCKLCTEPCVSTSGT